MFAANKCSIILPLCPISLFTVFMLITSWTLHLMSHEKINPLLTLIMVFNRPIFCQAFPFALYIAIAIYTQSKLYQGIYTAGLGMVFLSGENGYYILAISSAPRLGCRRCHLC